MDNDPGLIPQLRQQLRNFNALTEARGERGADTSYEAGIAKGLEIALEAATGVPGAQKLVDDLEPGDRVWTSGVGSGCWHTVESTSVGHLRCPAVLGAHHDVVHVVFTDGTQTSVQVGFAVRVAAADVASPANRVSVPHGLTGSHGIPEPMGVGDAMSAWATGARK